MEAGLKEKLNNDLKQAMRDGDTVKRSVLRLVLAAVKNAEIAQKTDLTDGDILGILAKDIKQREESIEAFEKGNRQDLMEKEKTELAIIQEYMPQQMTRDEIVSEARRIIEETGAQGPSDKGKVMPKLIAQLKGRADGREVNEVVTGLLSS